jgi:hypothetical protein
MDEVLQRERNEDVRNHFQSSRRLLHVRHKTESNESGLTGRRREGPNSKIVIWPTALWRRRSSEMLYEKCDAGRKHVLKGDLYFSHPNWYDADFRPYCRHPLRPALYGIPDPTQEEQARMMAHHRQQLTELLTNYGKVDMVCWDMWLGKPVWPQLRDQCGPNCER